jgi:hypothetical protein
MIVNYDGRDYKFNFDEITLDQLEIIGKDSHLTLHTFQTGLDFGDSRALRAAYWLMLHQNYGPTTTTPVPPLDEAGRGLKVVKFFRALNEAAKTAKESRDIGKQIKNLPRLMEIQQFLTNLSLQELALAKTMVNDRLQNPR